MWGKKANLSSGQEAINARFKAKMRYYPIALPLEDAVTFLFIFHEVALV